MVRIGSVLKLARWFALVVLVLLITGFVYEQVGERRDRTQFPQIGHSIDIGGRSLNMYCSGDGSPAVIFDSGGGMPGYSWLLVQPDVAKLTRACWYDRAGSGWSDPAPEPHGTDAIASDLHQLLSAGGVPPPYVLVGHSFGGFNVRMYYWLYPADVAGMVLVDPSHEDMSRLPNPAGVERPLLSLERLMPAALVVAQMLGRFGLFRLLASSPGVPPLGVTPDQWATLSSLRRRFTAQVSQESSAKGNVDLMRRAGSLRDLPLIVLTASKSLAASDSMGVKEFERARIALLGELTRKSSRGKQIVVINSGHMMPYEAPQAVIAAVREVVGDVQHPRIER